MNINWNQPSTQRGLAMALAGILQITVGKEISVDLLQVVISGVIGGLMLTSGLIGIFRSDPPTPPASAPDRLDPAALAELERLRRDAGFGDR